MNNTQKDNKKLVIQTIRMDESLRVEVEKTSKALRVSYQDAIRLAMEIGFAHLKKIEYNLVNAVITASTKE